MSDPFIAYPIIESSAKACLAINMDDFHIKTPLVFDKFNLVLNVSGKLRLPTGGGDNVKIDSRTEVMEEVVISIVSCCSINVNVTQKQNHPK